MMAPDACGDSWSMHLIQIPGRVGPVDLDELVDRLIERGLVLPAKRNIGAEIHAGLIPTPSGRWTLLVTLPGQSWAYVAGGSGSADVPYDHLARQAGLLVIHASYSDFSNSGAYGFHDVIELNGFDDRAFKPRDRSRSERPQGRVARPCPARTQRGRRGGDH